MEKTQKITMKDVRIDMKVENNEMKSAHLKSIESLFADFRSFPIIYQIRPKRLYGFCIFASFYSVKKSSLYRSEGGAAGSGLEPGQRLLREVRLLLRPAQETLRLPDQDQGFRLHNESTDDQSKKRSIPAPPPHSGSPALA